MEYSLAPYLILILFSYNFTKVEEAKAFQMGSSDQFAPSISNEVFIFDIRHITDR